MRNLSVLRDDRDLFYGEGTRLLRALTIQEGLKQWLELQTAFEGQLQQTATLFEQDRWNSLAELQARVSCLVE